MTLVVLCIMTILSIGSVHGAHHESFELDAGALSSLFGNQFGGPEDEPHNHDSPAPQQSQQLPQLPPQQITMPQMPMQQMTMQQMPMQQMPMQQMPMQQMPMQQMLMQQEPKRTARPQMTTDPRLLVISRPPPPQDKDQLILDQLTEQDQSLEKSRSLPSSCNVDPRMTVSFGDKMYLLSWLQWSGNDAQKSWNSATAYCRKNCMVLATLDNPQTANFLGMAGQNADVYGFWTGAFLAQDSDWKWQSTGHEIDPAIFSTGGMISRQPDNYVGRLSGGTKLEMCGAVLNNWFGDGSNMLHDVLCEEGLPFICETQQ